MKLKFILYITALLFAINSISGCAESEIVGTETPDVDTRSLRSTTFSNQIVNSDRTITDTEIITTNVTVTNGAKLTLKASQGVTINQPYTIEKGCQLEITHR